MPGGELGVRRKASSGKMTLWPQSTHVLLVRAEWGGGLWIYSSCPVLFPAALFLVRKEIETSKSSARPPKRLGLLVSADSNRNCFPTILPGWQWWWWWGWCWEIIPLAVMYQIIYMHYSKQPEKQGFLSQFYKWENEIRRPCSLPSCSVNEAKILT
jgi:hypothetical protein